MLFDLRWLGLDWDEGPDIGGPHAPYIQSERQDIYVTYLQRLQDIGLIYPCYCSRAEIARAASAPHGNEGPRYPGTCRYLTQPQRRQQEANNRRPSLRFRADDERMVSFSDLLLGPVKQQVQQTVGDFIVCRSDGIFAYQFAVVVDDALMHINQVVRGVDLLQSTARQILLFEALGFQVPTFAHVPLLLDEHRNRFSKRTESAGLEPLRARGVTPEEMVGQMAAECGLVDRGEQLSAGELAQLYKYHRFGGMRSILANLP
jgi:glutamyl-tRNA synthetase